MENKTSKNEWEQLFELFNSNDQQFLMDSFNDKTHKNVILTLVRKMINNESPGKYEKKRNNVIKKMEKEVKAAKEDIEAVKAARLAAAAATAKEAAEKRLAEEERKAAARKRQEEAQIRIAAEQKDAAEKFKVPFEKDN